MRITHETGSTPRSARLAGAPAARLAAGTFVGVVVSAGVVGCGRGLDASVDLPPSRPVELAAFADDEAAADPVVEGSDGRDDAGPPLRLEGASGPGAPAPAGTTAGGAATSEEVGRPVVIDVLVGEVNGRPIFADAFFEPLEDRLIALGRRTNPSEFVREASSIIGFELQQVVQNALFLAEAEADLSDQERAGLRYWLESLTAGETAKRGGTEGQAREEIARELGLTLEEYIESQRDEQLIRKLVIERIMPRVIVSWRDIETEYQRRLTEFQPPPKVSLSWIRLPASDETRIAEVRRRLDAGEDFSRVASDVGMAAGGSWQAFEMEPADLAETEFPPAMRQALGRLREPGDVTPMVSVGSAVAWFELTTVDRPAGRSLYDPDVQRQLREAIRSRRLQEEQVRFYRTLLDEGIYDELEDMAAVLVGIAVRRYGPR